MGADLFEREQKDRKKGPRLDYGLRGRAGIMLGNVSLRGGNSSFVEEVKAAEQVKAASNNSSEKTKKQLGKRDQVGNSLVASKVKNLLHHRP